VNDIDWLVSNITWPREQCSEFCTLIIKQGILKRIHNPDNPDNSENSLVFQESDTAMYEFSNSDNDVTDRESLSSDDDDLERVAGPANHVLNVGGQYFRVSTETLTKIPNSYFATLLSSGIPDDNGSYFIDRNYRIFELILVYLRDGCLVLPESQKDIWKLQQEAKFFKLQEIVNTCDSALANFVS